MNKDNGLWFTAGIDTQGFQRDAKKMEGVFSDITKQIEKDGLSVENVFRKMALSATAFFGVQQAQQFAKQIALVRGEFQQLEVAFRVMLGSEEKAVALMNQLVTTAAKTPFDLQGVASGAKQLLAYGLQADKVNETLVRLGDIAAGLTIPLGDLVYLYGTTMTQGRLYMQDFNQFMGRGIPIADELAKQFGVTKDQVRGLVEEGKIGFPQIEKAIISLTSEGGKFSGLMEEQSKTISGQISNIEDAFASMLNAIGKDNEGVINGVLQATGTLIENYETIGKAIGAVAATYGTYKAALFAVMAAEKLQVMSRAAAITHTNLLAVATGQLTKKMTVLNVVTKANPWVLLATVVVGAAAAMWSMADSTTVAERAAESLAEKKQKLADAEEKHKQEVNNLITVLESEVASEEDRREALVKLESKYPDIFKQYDTEYEKLKNLKKIKEEIALLDSANAKKSKGNIISSNQEEIAAIEAALRIRSNKAKEGDVDAFIGTHSDTLMKRLGTLKEENKIIQRELNEEIRVSNMTSEKLAGLTLEQLQAAINMRKKALEVVELRDAQGKTTKEVNIKGGYNSGVKTTEQVQAEMQQLEAELNKRNADIKTASDWQAAAIKRYNEAKKAYDDFLVSNEKLSAEEFEKKKEELKSALEEAKKALDNKTSNSNKKKTEIKSSALETRQILLDLEDETTDKRIAQIHLNYDKEIAEVKKKEKELKEARGGQLTEEDNDLLSAMTLAAEANKTKALEDIRKEELQSMRDYLMEYGTLEQQRLAIAEEFAEKIAKAQTEGEKAALRVQQAQAEKDIQQKAFDKSFDWSAIFQDLQGHTVEYLTSLRDQLQDVLKNGGLDPEQMAIAQEKLRELNDEISRSGGIFDFVGSRQREQNRREQEAKDAKDALTAALGEQGSIEAELNLAKLRGAPTDKILALEKQLADAREKTAKATTKAKEAEDSASRNAAQAVADWFADAQEFITEKGIDQIPDLLNSVGLGSLGDKAAQGLSAFNNASGAAADFASGNYIGAALKGINAIKDFGGMLGIGGGNAAEVQATIDRLSDRNEILTRAIEDLTEELEVNRGAMTMQAAQEAMRYQEEKNQNLKEIAQTQAGYHNAHHSWNSYWDGFSQEFVKEFSQRIGRSWSGDIWDLTAEEMDKLLSDPYAAELIKGTGKGGYGESVYEKLEDYAAEAEAIEEITKQLNETMTGMSFDGFYNSFIDNLMDMEKSAEDIFDDMAEYYQRAMLSRAVGEKMYEDLEKWYDKYAEAAKSGEGLTSEEIVQLNNEYKALVNEGIKKRDEIAKITGYGDTFQDAESAAAKSIQNITSEQANALEGRITAMQIAQEQGNVVRMEINNTLNRITHPIEKISLHSEELRNIALEQVGHLETISRNTHELFAINEKLGRIEKYTQNLE